MLRDVDRNYLEARGHRFSTHVEGNVTLLVIERYELPVGYTPETVDLLIQIPPDFPDAQLDMWWVYPVVTFAGTGAQPVNTESMQAFAGYTPEPGRVWQRFSRHPPWRAGVDELRTFLVALRLTMENEVPKAA